MKNLDDVLWKLLGEFVVIDILPKDWKNFEDVEEVRYFCTTIKGCVRLIDNKWLVNDVPIDSLSIYSIRYSKEIK